MVVVKVAVAKNGSIKNDSGKLVNIRVGSGSDRVAVMSLDRQCQGGSNDTSYKKEG
jgi:hypothetical protein